MKYFILFILHYTGRPSEYFLQRVFIFSGYFLVWYTVTVKLEHELKS